MIGQRGYLSFVPVAWGQKMKIRFIGSGILIKFGANEKCGLTPANGKTAGIRTLQDIFLQKNKKTSCNVLKLKANPLENVTIGTVLTSRTIGFSHFYSL
jgi:hypothetical protein